MTRLEKLNSAGLAYRLSGILACVSDMQLSEEEKNRLKELKSDSGIIAGRYLSAFAVAAMDVLGIEQYNGSDSDIKSLISEL